MAEDIIAFLKKHGHYFSRSAVERAIKVKPGMISRIISSEKWRHLTPEQEAKARAHLKKASEALTTFLKQ